jgi:myo-inositol-1(or 4)-monophosphatase
MINIAIKAALKAGRFLKANLGKAKSIEYKQEEINLVTELDRKSEALIIEIIKQHYPMHDILAEESGSHNRASDYKWIIDPLDGTTNYAHGLPIYGVSIGLELRGEIIAGVIYNPNLEELFAAEKGHGATLNSMPIRVSETSELIKSLLVTGFPYNVKENPFNCIEHFSNFLVTARAVRRLGSASLDMAYLACGRFDGFWEVSLNPWDSAAGSLIVTEAGGKITDFSGGPFSIYSNPILATNGRIHEQMIEILKRGSVAVP